MSIYHDEVEIEDFEYDEEEEMYYYPCPCGDRFQISKVRASKQTTESFWFSFKCCSSLLPQEELMEGEEVATCPSCSLIIKVIYDPDMFKAEEDESAALNEKLGELKLEKN
ncbi:hypothetical protein KR222_006870 [Zaprionus bogoriensis]|nr:hypothetical protein KR222_006870 [Zaprionus bogoriensis]